MNKRWMLNPSLVAMLIFFSRLAWGQTDPVEQLKQDLQLCMTELHCSPCANRPQRVTARSGPSLPITRNGAQ